MSVYNKKSDKVRLYSLKNEMDHVDSQLDEISSFQRDIRIFFIGIFVGFFTNIIVAGLWEWFPNFREYIFLIASVGLVLVIYFLFNILNKSNEQKRQFEKELTKLSMADFFERFSAKKR